MFKPILHKLCAKYFKEAWDDGYKQALAEQSYEREKGASIQYHVQLKKLLGKRVVYLPNEWQDPFFGTVVGAGPRNTTEVVVADFLTELNNNKVLISYKSLYHADMLFVEAILKLDPMQRWNLSAGKAFNENIWKSKPTGAKQLTEPEELLAKLESRNFFLE